MIPLRDNIATRRVPVITVALIAVNLGVFVLNALMPQRELEPVLFQYGLIPAKIFKPVAVAEYYWRQFGLNVPVRYSWSEALLPMFTSMFLHGGVLHLLGNMWILWIFGDNVEDCFGHLGFLLFYLACGLISGTVQVLSAPLSPVVTIGASGAVAGVMGAYMLLYPYARVMTLVWFIFFIDIWPIPAFVYLFFWFLLQVLSGTASLGSHAFSGGVAWWAHIGGFLAGFGFVLFSGIQPHGQYITSYSKRRVPWLPYSDRR